MHHIRFRLKLCPDPAFKGRERRGRGGKGGGKKEKGMERNRGVEKGGKSSGVARI